MLFPVSAAHICLSRMCTEKDARAGIFFCIGSSLLYDRERFFRLISDLFWRFAFSVYCQSNSDISQV